MTEPGIGIRQPDGQEESYTSSADTPRESGPEATREALASPEPFRLSESELDERDAMFSGPRKEQGPAMTEPDSRDEPLGEEIEETPVPVPPD